LEGGNMAKQPAKSTQPLKRVHRNLSKDQVDALRRDLAQTVPIAHASIAQLVRTMRLATRRSQNEYAQLCGVAPRVLKRIEAGELHVQLESLEKLIKPFGYAIGLVQIES
jgi:ribosome-binding protein aMBF1 (putative translation factor)